MTSFLMIGLIYSCSIFLAVAAFLRFFILKRLAAMDRYFMRAPLGLSGFVVGIFLFVVAWV